MRQYLTRGIGHCLLCRNWCVKCNNQESGFNDNEWFNKASATMTSTAQANLNGVMVFDHNEIWGINE